jgi:uncharacterized ParB-like nuclease family protein
VKEDIENIELSIAKIVTTKGTQTRVATDEDTIAEYAEAMQAGAEFPPVVVFHDGTIFYAADGFHRILSACRIGRKTITAEVHKGSRQDALIYALGANRANGLRRKNEDKRKCVEIALREFEGWSDHKIAEVCGVSQPFVLKVRPQVITVITCPTPSQPTTQEEPPKRLGKDGKQYPATKSWTAPEITPAPVDKPNVIPINQLPRPCIGQMHCDNAIRQLEKIDSRDTELADALRRIIAWATKKLIEMEESVA